MMSRCAGSRDLNRRRWIVFNLGGPVRVLNAIHGAADGGDAGMDTVVIALIAVAMPFMKMKSIRAGSEDR